MISSQDRVTIVALIKEANADGARLFMCCEVVGITERTYERWVQFGNVKEDQRPFAIKEPKNKLSEAEYKSILRIVNMPEYADLPPSQIVPALADKGMYIASESTFYKILKNENLLTHRGRSKAPQKSNRPKTHIATKPNQVWTWDISYLNGGVKGMYYRLYMIVDIFSRKIVGWEVWEDETGEHASEMMEKAVVSEKVFKKPLVLHSDNGSAMKSSTLKAKLELLGVLSSFSRPRVSNDNPYSEALFRTCKYRPGYPRRGFKDIEKAREWVDQFVYWYNNVHYHSGINFYTPVSIHEGYSKIISEKRKKVYETAKELHPERWTRGTRNWNTHEFVALNPVKEDEVKQSVSG